MVDAYFQMAVLRAALPVDVFRLQIPDFIDDKDALFAQFFDIPVRLTPSRFCEKDCESL